MPVAICLGTRRVRMGIRTRLVGSRCIAASGFELTITPQSSQRLCVQNMMTEASTE